MIDVRLILSEMFRGSVVENAPIQTPIETFNGFMVDTITNIEWSFGKPFELLNPMEASRALIDLGDAVKRQLQTCDWGVTQQLFRAQDASIDACRTSACLYSACTFLYQTKCNVLGVSPEKEFAKPELA